MRICSRAAYVLHVASPRHCAISLPPCFGRAGVAGASLYPGGPHRSGNRMVGQSGTAVAGALGAGRSSRAVQRVPSTRSRPCPPPPRCGANRSNCRSRSKLHYARQRLCRAETRRPWSGHVCSSNKLRRSESLPKTRCCCFRSSTASGSQNVVAFNGDAGASSRRSS